MNTRNEFISFMLENIGGICLAVVLALGFGVLMFLYVQDQIRPVSESEVCTYEVFFWGSRICKDAGSPAAAKATVTAIKATVTAIKATEAHYIAQTATAAPVIIQRGDVTIYRYYDSERETYIYICTRGSAIPCSAGDK